MKPMELDSEAGRLYRLRDSRGFTLTEAALVVMFAAVLTGVPVLLTFDQTCGYLPCLRPKPKSPY